MRKSNRKQVRANALNEKALQEGQLPYVIASVKRDIDAKAVLATFECEACSNNFTAQANTKPHCFNCGSEKVVSTELTEGIGELAKSEELTSVDCGGCGTHNIVADTLLPKMKGTMHCVHCGDEMYFDGGDQAPVMDADPNAVDVTETEDLDEDMDADGLGDDLGDQDLSEGDDVDDEDQGDVEFSGEDEEDDLEESAEGQGEDLQQDAGQEQDLQQEVQQDAGQDVDDFGGDTIGEADDDLDSVDVNDQSIQANVLKLAKISKASKLELVSHEKTILAFVNRMPVAVLTEKASGDNKDVFYTEGFHNAIKHTASTAGTRKALASYGFKPIAIKLDRKRVESSIVSDLVAKERAKYTEQLAGLKSDFISALSVAAVGINKGFFKNKPNALKAALFDELATLNVRSPSVIIDKVFAAYGDSYNKTLIEAALELVGKPKEVFAALAESIGDTNYQPVAAEGEDEDGEQEDAIECDETDFDNMGDSDADLQQDVQESNVTPIKSIQKSVASVRKLTGSTIFAKAL